MMEGKPSAMPGANPRLSICIATFNRGAFIAQTLDCLIAQLDPRVELLIVDGASPDNTAAVVAPYVNGDDRVRYVRESVNSGVDADYDRAVGYARGDYCWLMTDDDLLEPEALALVLAALEDGPDLVVVNAQVSTADFSRVLTERMLAIEVDREYESGTQAFFAETANYLSFIGAVVVKRSIWLERSRTAYYGSLFIHVGVLFQAPLPGRIHVLATPLIKIRYGNAMWTPRSFEIWMFMWPALIWSFGGYSDAAKARVSAREPWKILLNLVYRRAVGSYSIVEFEKFVAGKHSVGATAQAWLVARVPGPVANFVSGLFCILTNRRGRGAAYNLAQSPHSTFVSRFAARAKNNRCSGRANGSR
jgi:abequosyltransferase